MIREKMLGVVNADGVVVGFLLADAKTDAGVLSVQSKAGTPGCTIGGTNLGGHGRWRGDIQ